jgi:hypothetical protein
MALGSTHPLTEVSTRNLPGGKERPARGADNLTAICEPTVNCMRLRGLLQGFLYFYRGSEELTVSILRVPTL